jgi:hypothetical protein
MLGLHLSSRGPGSRPNQSMWDLWWKMWHSHRFFSEFFGFRFQLSFHHCSLYSYSLGDEQQALYTTAVQRHLIPSTWKTSISFNFVIWKQRLSSLCPRGVLKLTTYCKMEWVNTNLFSLSNPIKIQAIFYYGARREMVCPIFIILLQATPCYSYIRFIIILFTASKFSHSWLI